MKRLALFVTLTLLLMTGCGSLPVAQQSGKDDMAALLFVSQKEYAGENLSIQLDDTQFEAKAVKAKKANRKGTVYSVAPGSRHLIVKDNHGEVLYDKMIFLSTQETKQIQLP